MQMMNPSPGIFPLYICTVSKSVGLWEYFVVNTCTLRQQEVKIYEDATDEGKRTEMHDDRQISIRLHETSTCCCEDV